jgi:PAS domain S-box-containing protein
MWQLSQDLLVLVGPDGIYRAVNPAWRTLLGYEPDEIIGRHFADFIHPDESRQRPTR